MKRFLLTFFVVILFLGLASCLAACGNFNFFDKDTESDIIPQKDLLKEHKELINRLQQTTEEYNSSLGTLESLYQDCIDHISLHGDECQVEKNINFLSLPDMIAHVKLNNRLNDGTDYETEYSILYSIYQQCTEHKNAHGDKCNIYNNSNFKVLLENMFYGEWKDADGNYISLSYVYSDYNNTKGDSWLSSNLSNSKKYGNTYYYYFETKDSNLIIGYKDKISEETTDNYIVTFNSNSITIYSKINSKTYFMSSNTDFEKIVRGNAKKAYIYIAKKIFSFKYPSSVKITKCHVTGDIVYARIQATNGFGGTINSNYKLYESNGYYYISETSEVFDTNIDLDELNQKLQNYVISGG